MKTSDNRRFCYAEVDLRLPRKAIDVVAEVPSRKGSKPLIVCLDTKHWISLGRAFYQQTEHQPDSELLNCIEKLATRGDAVFPLTDHNIYEVQKCSDPKRRTRTVNFMLNISSGLTIVPFNALCNVQMHNALCTVFNIKKKPVEYRSHILRTTALGAFGQELEVDFDDSFQVAWVQRHLCSKDGVRKHWLDEKYPPPIAEMEDISTRWAIRDQERRNNDHLPYANRLAAEGSHPGGSKHQSIYPRIKRYGDDLEIAGLEEWCEDDSNSTLLIRSIPCLDVMQRLQARRDRDPNQTTDGNDIDDLHFLGSYVPVADVVGTEKRWAHFCKLEKLGKEFGTRIAGDSNKLIEVLRDSQ